MGDISKGFQPFKAVVDGKDVMVEGIGMPKALFKAMAEGGEGAKSGGDVSAHHFVGCWHMNYMWGHVMDVWGNIVYVYHCHPYGSPFAIW